MTSDTATRGLHRNPDYCEDMTAAGTQTSTRDRLLDSFETLLKDGGSRAATLDAVASDRKSVV